MPPLHAHLGRAGEPRFLGAIGDLGERQRVGLRIDLALREGAEPAADIADVREVDVAVPDVGDLGPDRLGPHVVGDAAQRLQGRALGPEQGKRLGVRDAAPGLRVPERRTDVGVQPGRRHDVLVPRGGHRVLRGERAVDILGVIAKARVEPFREREVDRPRARA